MQAAMTRLTRSQTGTASRRASRPKGPVRPRGFRAGSSGGPAPRRACHAQSVQHMKTKHMVSEDVEAATRLLGDGIGAYVFIFCFLQWKWHRDVRIHYERIDKERKERKQEWDKRSGGSKKKPPL